MEWKNTNAFLRGKVVKSFLPFEKHPNLINDNFQNLYPGDEVYIFETKGERWARGWVIKKPSPLDFTITSVNLDQIPTQIDQICVFPLKYVQVLEEVGFGEKVHSSANGSRADEQSIPSLQQSEIARRQAAGDSMENSMASLAKQRVPPLPIMSFTSNDDLVHEIRYTLDLLNSHIFALYCVGEYRLFDKLSAIYRSLDDLRIKISHDILTASELNVAKETAILLLNRIPKKLASSADRLALVSWGHDDHQVADTSGYKAILARDAFLGNLLTIGNSLPSMISLYQSMCALAPNFPINAHLHKNDYSLVPPDNKVFSFEAPSHILVELKTMSSSSSYEPPGFENVCAYLYLRNNQRILTEVYSVKASSVQKLILVGRVSAALFKNLPSSEIENRKVYLTVKIFEEVEVKAKEPSKPGQTEKIRRGIAAGVSDVTRVVSKSSDSMALEEAQEFSVKLYGSYISQNAKLNSDENDGWGGLVDRIIDGSAHGVAVNPRAEKMTLIIKKFKQSALSEKNIGGSSTISRIGPMIFDPLAESYERIYLVLKKVTMLNNASKDDQLTLWLNAPTNESITFSKSANEEELRRWQFPTISPYESIVETIKVNGISTCVSKSGPSNEHLGFYLHVNGVLVGEGKLTYKAGGALVDLNKQSSQEVQVLSVLTKSCIAKIDIKTDYVGKTYNSDASIQNIIHFGKVLKNGTKDIEELSKSLVSFTKLELHQLVKYFKELLASLFSLIHFTTEQPQSSSILELQDVAFKGLISLLDTVFGKKNQYSYLLDVFTDMQNLAPVGDLVLSKVADVFSNAEVTWTSTSRSLSRVLHILIKLSANSVHEVESTESYLKALDKITGAISYFLGIHSNSLITDQILILDTIDHIFTFNLHIGEVESLRYISDFIDAVKTRGLGLNDNTVNKKANYKDHEVIISKLLLINRLFNTVYIKTPSSRVLLITNAVKWVMEVYTGLTDVDAVRLASTILNSVCTLLWNTLSTDCCDKDIFMCQSLTRFLPVIAKVFVRYNKFTREQGYYKPKRVFTRIFSAEYPFKEISVDPDVNEETFVEVLAELASVFCFVAQLGKEVDMNDSLSTLLDPQSDLFSSSTYLMDNCQNKDLLTLITGINYIRRGKFIPEGKWLSLYSLYVEGCLKALELVSKSLIMRFIPSSETPELFSRSLWGSYLKALLKLACSVPVAFEHLSDVPKNACLKITGDMRDRVSFLFDETWNALAWEAPKEEALRFGLDRYGGYQVEFFNNDYGLVQDLMLYALQKNTASQEVAAKVLWCMMVSEFVLTESLEDIETECLTGLYNIYCREKYKPSPAEQQSFLDELKQTIRLDREDIAFPAVCEFIESLEGFFVTLNELNSVPVGREFDDDRTFQKLNINAYLKKANKPELFNSFIHNMFEDNVKKGDFIQAALSLELLAATYSWDPHFELPPSVKPKFPQQSSFERKEALYNMIAENYIKGSSFERALDTYNELLVSYNENTYDLKSLASVHHKLAKLYLELEGSDKLTPTYFKVSFIGGGFPVNVRGKEQIYEGFPFEHITSIHERLLKVYPGARVITDEQEAQKILEKVQTGRYLYITTVEPVNEISDKLFNTSLGVRQYAKNKDLRFFTSLKKLPGATSIYDLWTEETTYETHQSFPTLMNRSEIKTSKVLRLSPLDNAIRAIINKNNDLIQLESMINSALKQKADHTLLLNDLSRQLVGTVDSPVNGGVGQYRQFFVDKTYQTEEHAGTVRLLKDAFNDLALILHRCLYLHGLLVSGSMRASHDTLIDLYKQNFKDEVGSLGITTTYDTSAVRYTQSLLSLNSDRRSSLASSSVLQGNYPTTAPKLTRTTSRNSSAGSSISGLSGISSLKTAATNGSARSGSTRTMKRSVLHWKSAVNGYRS